jgi:hypothetical protein
MSPQHAMPFEDLERIYEALALAIDHVGPDQETLMLAKLVLFLAQRSGDVNDVLDCLTAAQKRECNPCSTST